MTFTTDDPQGVSFQTTEANDYFRSLNQGDTIVGIVHTHPADGRPSPDDANVFSLLSDRMSQFSFFPATVDPNSVSYIIDGTAIVREYNSDQLEQVTGNASDRFGAIINNDGTINITLDCTNS